jgi:hypothetical protein
LNRLFNDLIEDFDLVQFLEIVPGFCRSSLVDDPVRKITNLGKETFQTAVKELLERTWSSNSLPDSEKMRRLVACVNVADAVRLSDVALSILKDIFSGDWNNALRSVDVGQFLISQGKYSGQKMGLCAQSIVAGIISNVQANDDKWVALATDQLGASLPRYLEHGNDNVLLANLIHFIRQNTGDDLNEDLPEALSTILPTLSKFHIRHTLPELQGDFLSLWDDIDREAKNHEVFSEICNTIRNLHDVLTQGHPLDSEVRTDPLEHANTNDNTRSITSSRSSSDPAPAISSHNPPLPRIRTLSQQTPGHINSEPADDSSVSFGVVKSA